VESFFAGWLFALAQVVKKTIKTVSIVIILIDLFFEVSNIKFSTEFRVVVQIVFFRFTSLIYR
jgi:hypothetical protein